MSATKAPKKSVKQLQKVIDEMAADLLAMAQKLDADKQSVRLPANPSIVIWNQIVDWLNENKPEPVFPKEVPVKLVPMGEGGEA